MNVHPLAFVIVIAAILAVLIVLVTLSGTIYAVTSAILKLVAARKDRVRGFDVLPPAQAANEDDTRST